MAYILTVEDRRDLWRNLLAQSAHIHDLQWLLMGDWNAVMNCTDRPNGGDVTGYEMADMQSFIDQAALVELNSIGHFYSWSSKGDPATRTFSRIDRFFGNNRWMQQHYLSKVEYINPGISDHSPLYLSMDMGATDGKGRPFLFFNYLEQHTQKVWLQMLGIV